MTGLVAQGQAPVAKPARRLVVAGWISFGLGMIGGWVLFLASFVIGIVLIVRGRPVHGVVLMLLSLSGPGLSMIVADTLVTILGA